PSRPAVALLLADPVSKPAAHLAELPLAARLGLLRDHDVSDRQHAVPAAADDPRLRARARHDDRLAAADLRRAGARMAGDAEAVAPPRIGDGDRGHRDDSG